MNKGNKKDKQVNEDSKGSLNRIRNSGNVNSKEGMNANVSRVKGDDSNKVKGNSKGSVNRTVVEHKTNDSNGGGKHVVVEHLYTKKGTYSKEDKDPSLIPGPSYPTLPNKSDQGGGKVKRLGNELIAKALMANNGKISKTAASLHISHWSLKQHLNKNPELMKLMVVGKEAELDYVEDKFMDAVKLGNLSAMIFYLKCQGRSRGWIERPEDSKTNKPNVTFKYTLVMPDKKRKVIDMGTITAEEAH